MKKILVISASIIGIVLVLGAALGYFLLAPKESTRPDNPLVKGVNYVGMSVSDIQQSADLYHSAAGLTEVAENIGHTHLYPSFDGDSASGAHQPVNSKLLQSVNAQVLMMEFDATSNSALSPVPVNGPGIAHLCFQVNQETGTYQGFLASGSTAVGNPEMIQVNPNNPVYYGYVKDTDGILVEVEHVDIPALNLAVPPKNDYRIRHISLATPNMQRLIDFYSVILEEENPRRVGRYIHLSGEKVDGISGLANSEIEMAWFQVRNLELEIIQYHSHPTSDIITPRPFEAIGYNSIMFDVVDIQKLQALLVKLGAQIDVTPTQTDNGWVMYARDPDNNLLGFQQLSNDSLFSAEQFSGNGT